MDRRIAGIAIGVTLALFSNAAGLQAQRATERYIPVGQSPGLSGIYSYIGQVVEVAANGSSVTVEYEGESRTIQITAETNVWLDRSRLRQPNATGGVADLVTGRTIEVKYVDAETRDRAEWIKVVIE